MYLMIKVSIYLPLLDTKSIDLIGDNNDKVEGKINGVAKFNSLSVISQIGVA